MAVADKMDKQRVSGTIVSQVGQAPSLVPASGDLAPENEFELSQILPTKQNAALFTKETPSYLSIGDEIDVDSLHSLRERDDKQSNNILQKNDSEFNADSLHGDRIESDVSILLGRRDRSDDDNQHDNSTFKTFMQRDSYGPEKQNMKRKTLSDSSDNDTVKKQKRTLHLPGKNITEGTESDSVIDYIQQTFLPKFYKVWMFGVPFNMRYCLELEKKSDLHRLNEALMKGVPIDVTLEEGTESQLTENTGMNDLDSGAANNNCQEEILDVPFISNGTSQIDHFRAGTTVKTNVSEEMNDTTSSSLSFSASQGWYSDISDEEEDVLNNNTRELEQLNVDSFHVDNPPPSSHIEQNKNDAATEKVHVPEGKKRTRQSVNYTDQDAGKTIPNPDKDEAANKTGQIHQINSDREMARGKKRQRQQSKDTVNKKVAVNHATRAAEQGETFDFDKSRILVDTLQPVLYSVFPRHEESHHEAAETQSSESDEEEKKSLSGLPKLDIMRPFAEQHGPTTKEPPPSHEEVKLKLKQRLTKQMEPIRVSEQQDVRIKDIKKEKPEIYSDDGTSMEEVDPERTLLYGYDGPGGFVHYDSEEYTDRQQVHQGFAGRFSSSEIEGDS